MSMAIRTYDGPQNHKSPHHVYTPYFGFDYCCLSPELVGVYRLPYVVCHAVRVSLEISVVNRSSGIHISLASAARAASRARRCCTRQFCIDTFSACLKTFQGVNIILNPHFRGLHTNSLYDY